MAEPLAEGSRQEWIRQTLAEAPTEYPNSVKQRVARALTPSKDSTANDYEIAA